jgi:hypothetical protein
MEPFVEDGREKCSHCGCNLPPIAKATPIVSPAAVESTASAPPVSLAYEQASKIFYARRGMPWYAGGGLLLMLLFFLVLPALRMEADGAGEQMPLLEIKSLNCALVHKTSIHVVGELGNIATHPIMNIAVDMEFQLDDGALADRATTHVIPPKLAAGETIGFKLYARNYGREDASECRISRIYHFHNNRPIAFRDSQASDGGHEIIAQEQENGRT